MYCSYKWYNVLLVGHHQQSIHLIQHPIMVVTLSHVRLSMLALQSQLLTLSHTWSFHHFYRFSSFSPLFHLLFRHFWHLFMLSYLLNVMIHMWRFLMHLFLNHFESSYFAPLSHLLHHISSFCHHYFIFCRVLTHPLNPH
jgi:hypothetical protein